MIALLGPRQAWHVFAAGLSYGVRSFFPVTWSHHVVIINPHIYPHTLMHVMLYQVHHPLAKPTACNGVPAADSIKGNSQAVFWCPGVGAHCSGTPMLGHYTCRRWHITHCTDCRPCLEDNVSSGISCCVTHPVPLNIHPS